MINLVINKKAYDENVIFDNTNICINEKEFIAIKGKSGSGKSTLLAILGLLESFNGEYIFNDAIINDKNREEIRKNNLAYIFQKPFLIPYLTVKDNIIMPLKNLKEKIDEEKLNNIIKLLDLSAIINRYPENLSGGEAERVSIARAVMSNRKIILCDEPTGSLDPQNALNAMNYLLEIKNNYSSTIIMVTHSNEFDDFFDKIYKIEDKRIVLYENN